MSKTARTEANRVTGHPPGMLQDDSRELTAWLAGKPDAMMHARDAVAKIRADTDEHWCELCGDSLTTLKHDESIGYYRDCSHCGSEYQGEQERAMNARPCSECGQSGWHKLSCSQRTDRAPQMPAMRDAGGAVTVCQRPCRCGPDGCSDSVSCPRRTER